MSSDSEMLERFIQGPETLVERLVNPTERDSAPDQSKGAKEEANKSMKDLDKQMHAVTESGMLVEARKAQHGMLRALFGLHRYIPTPKLC